MIIAFPILSVYLRSPLLRSGAGSRKARKHVVVGASGSAGEDVNWGACVDSVRRAALPFGLFLPGRGLPPGGARPAGRGARLPCPGAHRPQRPVRLHGVRPGRPAGGPPADHRGGSHAARMLRRGRRTRRRPPRHPPGRNAPRATPTSAACSPRPTWARSAGPPSLPLDSLLERPEGLILLTRMPRRARVAAALDSSVADGEALDAPPRPAVRARKRLRGAAGQRGEGRSAPATRRSAAGRPPGARRGRDGQRPLPPPRAAPAPGRARLDPEPHHAGRRPRRQAGQPALPPASEPWEMRHRFQSRPEALTNTLLIAERCAAFDLTEDLGYEFPDFEGSERGGADRSRSRRHAVWREISRAVRAGKRPGARRRRAAAHRARWWTSTAWRASSWSTGTSWTWPARWRARSGARLPGPARGSRRAEAGARRSRPSSAT